MTKSTGSALRRVSLAGMLAGATAVLPAMAVQNPQAAANSAAAAHRSSPYHAASVSPKAKDYYLVRWGVDSLSAKTAESGLMIRFNYRVVDAKKANELNDKTASPFLLDERAGVQLVVPTMDRIGQLRQSGTPDAGKTYWMVFSNKEKHVKPGDRVSVIIGKFRADGLLVQQ